MDMLEYESAIFAGGEIVLHLLQLGGGHFVALEFFDLGINPCSTSSGL